MLTSENTYWFFHSQKLRLVDTSYVHAISYIVLVILFSLATSEIDGRMLFLFK